MRSSSRRGRTLAGLGLNQLGRGKFARRGVFLAEALDPVASMAEMEEAGLAVGVTDLPAV